MAPKELTDQTLVSGEEYTITCGSPLANGCKETAQGSGYDDLFSILQEGWWRDPKNQTWICPKCSKIVKQH